MSTKSVLPKIAILISGRGSNMRALIEASHRPDFPAKIELVLANKPQAAGLDYAKQHDIRTAIVDHRRFEDRESFEHDLDHVLKAAQIDLICLAGFMRVLTPWFINRWHGRLINIHPALLPSYKGLNTHERALADGVKLHGCSVHHVVPEVDAGPIIAQAAVPVFETDTVETLAARVLAAEHRLYPLALLKVLTGDAHFAGKPAETSQFISV
jgi:phosphoribosylglycinamide formyltransferase 1